MGFFCYNSFTNAGPIFLSRLWSFDSKSRSDSKTYFLVNLPRTIPNFLLQQLHKRGSHFFVSSLKKMGRRKVLDIWAGNRNMPTGKKPDRTILRTWINLHVNQKIVRPLCAELTKVPNGRRVAPYTRKFFSLRESLFIDPRFSPLKNNDSSSRKTG